jgi:hypothetical protein
VLGAPIGDGVGREVMVARRVHGGREHSTEGLREEAREPSRMTAR